MVIRRRRVEGELVVEQTRDLASVAAILTPAGIKIEGLACPSACYLMAYLGSEPVGVVGIETKVDAALMHALVVVEPMRRRGIGKALVEAARAAACARGARSVYVLANGKGGEYLKRFGFKPVAIDEMPAAFSSASMVDAVWAGPGEISPSFALYLDISRDGVISR